MAGKMSAKEAAKKTGAVLEKARNAERERAELEAKKQKASALAQLPTTLSRIFSGIDESATLGRDWFRETVYNPTLASMVCSKLQSEGYKATYDGDNGGYDYDGGYRGPTTSWTISVRW
jgi:hypothetical protein